MRTRKRITALGATTALALTMGLGVAPTAFAEQTEAPAQSQQAESNEGTFSVTYNGQTLVLEPTDTATGVHYAPQNNATFTVESANNFPETLTAVSTDGTQVVLGKTSKVIRTLPSNTFGMGTVTTKYWIYTCNALGAHFQVQMDNVDDPGTSFGEKITVENAEHTEFSLHKSQDLNAWYEAAYEYQHTASEPVLSGIALTNGDTAPIEWESTTSDTRTIDSIERPVEIRKGTASGLVTVEPTGNIFASSLNEYWTVQVTDVTVLDPVSTDTPSDSEETTQPAIPAENTSSATTGADQNNTVDSETTDNKNANHSALASTGSSITGIAIIAAIFASIGIALIHRMRALK